MIKKNVNVQTQWCIIQIEFLLLVIFLKKRRLKMKLQEKAEALKENLRNLIQQIKEKNLQNEQYYLNWIDDINALSVEF